MIIDTDVLIWYLRRNSKARKVVEGHPGSSVSVVTYMELVEGMRNLSELRQVRKTFGAWSVSILYLCRLRRRGQSSSVAVLRRVESPEAG